MYKNVDILGINISSVTIHEAIENIKKYIKYGNKNYKVYTPNTDFIVRSVKDIKFKNILNNSDLNIADGMPLVWMSRLLGAPIKEKVAGSDLVFKLCKTASIEGYTIFLLGSLNNIALKAKKRLEAFYPQIKIVGAFSPSFGFDKNDSELKEIIKMINKSEPDILFVGLGSPKQEFFISKYSSEYKAKVSIGVGASIDFAAGVKKMPPQFLKKLGFAWLWRLCDEPKRLWRRYLIHDMKFFYYILLQKFSKRFYK